ncbi:hypothetical protein [Streptomyces radicis]|uniref:Integral membrane protein n=1 Tax=Streptomyces radicis TaxID=1750517 RepID=A0A3A9WK55_9ACTN|nr:hypothetical protein [Streptomyces radicis]RKN12912.1 hypothetical protein D7319_00750 [Streptomyces radicis]RKN27875.1 hypothetical protein D7318_02145 [Streptomyces radicis]
MAEQVTVGELLMAEYDQIKEEQRARISFRDNLLYATLASMAAVVAAVLQADGRPGLLLLLPPVSVLLGWTYVVNDEKISAVGRYVREELAPRLAELSGGHEPPKVFGWEVRHRADDRRTTRKRLQLAVDLLTFCLAPIAALVVFWSSGAGPLSLLLVSLGELAAITVLGWQIVTYADTTRS